MTAKQKPRIRRMGGDWYVFDVPNPAEPLQVGACDRSLWQAWHKYRRTRESLVERLHSQQRSERDDGH